MRLILHKAPIAYKNRVDTCTTRELDKPFIPYTHARTHAHTAYEFGRCGHRTTEKHYFYATLEMTSKGNKLEQ